MEKFARRIACSVFVVAFLGSGGPFVRLAPVLFAFLLHCRISYRNDNLSKKPPEPIVMQPYICLEGENRAQRRKILR